MTGIRPPECRKWPEFARRTRYSLETTCRHAGASLKFISRKLSAFTGNWGMCANPRNPRARFFTCEHPGCLEFDDESRTDYLTTSEAATPVGFFRSGKRNCGGGAFAPSAEPDFLCTHQRDQGVESMRAELEQRLRERWPTWLNLETNLSQVDALWLRAR
jgi:hypothetical protein